MSVATPISLGKQSLPPLTDRRAVLQHVADQYPSDLVAHQRRDVERIAFNISIAFDSIGDRQPDQLSIADLGGGVGLFSVGCAALGAKRSVLVDDFNDPVNHRIGPNVLNLHRGYGVEVHSRDVVAAGIADITGPFDVITSFDSMEHWHHSPKRLFGEIVQKLNPGGAFVLGVPNCVNLRKRITGIFGRNKWSSMQEWYELPEFRGHVREPDVDDLHYIAKSMGLTDVKIYGRNWLGYYSASAVTRAVTPFVDGLLRLFPTLCADIYLVARKPK